jgi:hypothetical protein
MGQANVVVAREHTRVDVVVTLSADVAKQLQSNNLYRVTVFCAPDTGLNQLSAADIAFPHQIKLSCQGQPGRPDEQTWINTSSRYHILHTEEGGL